MTDASRVLIVGDIGSTVAFHVGDEAMVEAMVGAPDGPSWVAVSLDPNGTTRRLGIPAVPRLGFSSEDAEARERRLAEVLGFDAAGGAPVDDPAREVLEALDAARGLVVAGGGNLSSTWPEHVYERVALMSMAGRRGLPVVVSGQTIGPRLEVRERELLASALGEAALVGVREPASHRLALELGVPRDRLVLQLDDAMFLGEATEPPPRAERPFLAVTICELGLDDDDPELLESLACQLADVALRTGAELALVPHVGACDGLPRADVRIAAALERRLADLGVPAWSPGLLSPVETARLTRGAELVIATRYHPLVFALGAGVPSLAVHLDDYTRTKMEGALGFAGLETWSLHVRVAATGLLTDAALELWDRREQVRAHLAALLPGWRTAAERHLRGVTMVLSGSEPPAHAPGLPEPRDAPHPTGAWRARAKVAGDRLLHEEAERRELSAYATALRESFAEAERYALSLRAALDETERERDELAGRLREPRWRRRRLPNRTTAARPQAPAGGLVLSDLRHEQTGRDASASMLVRRDGQDLGRLVLRRHGSGLDEIDPTATPFVAIAAVLGTTQEMDVRIEGPVDEAARIGGERAGVVLGGWFGWRPARITAAARAAAATPSPSVGLLFSRGLDSMATYVRHRDRIDTLVSLDWHDPPYATEGTSAIWRGTETAAIEAGLPLIRVSTNAREFLDPVAAWEIAHGSVLGALAQLVSPSVGELLKAGSFPPGREAPSGTHPGLDPLWSSSSLRIVYDDGGGGRNEKAALVAGTRFCSRNLKVCFERPGDGNCGRCTKCLLTMTNFYIAGRLDAVRDRFDAPLSPQAVREVAICGTPPTPTNCALILERLAADDPLREPWERMLEQGLARDAATVRAAGTTPRVHAAEPGATSGEDDGQRS